MVVTCFGKLTVVLHFFASPSMKLLNYSFLNVTIFRGPWAAIGVWIYTYRKPSVVLKICNSNKAAVMKKTYWKAPLKCKALLAFSKLVVEVSRSLYWNNVFSQRSYRKHWNLTAYRHKTYWFNSKKDDPSSETFPSIMLLCMRNSTLPGWGGYMEK